MIEKLKQVREAFARTLEYIPLEPEYSKAKQALATLDEIIADVPERELLGKKHLKTPKLFPSGNYSEWTSEEWNQELSKCDHDFEQADDGISICLDCRLHNNFMGDVASGNTAETSRSSGTSSPTKQPADVVELALLAYMKERSAQCGEPFDRGMLETLKKDAPEEYAEQIVAMQCAIESTRPDALAWQPISTAPHTNTDVLVCFNHGKGAIAIARTPGTGEWWEGLTKIRTPTHWMPLPPAPAERQDV